MRRFFRRYLPELESLRTQRWFAFMGQSVLHPRLWHLNRRSVALAVAIGLFTGLIPGPVQMLCAAFFCVLFRANLPVAVICTWYTNPFTIVPLYVLAFALGKLFTHSQAVFELPPAFDWNTMGEILPLYWEWFTGLGKPLAVGLVSMAILFAGLGYGVVRVIWRLALVRRIQRRRDHFARKTVVRT
jgi:uncharacterized protein